MAKIQLLASLLCIKFVIMFFNLKSVKVMFPMPIFTAMFISELCIRRPLMVIQVCGIRGGFDLVSDIPLLPDGNKLCASNPG